jgi:hypothetical protein
MNKADEKFLKKCSKVLEDERKIRLNKIADKITYRIYNKSLLKLAYDASKLELWDDVVRIIESVDDGYLDNDLVNEEPKFIDKVYELAIFLIDAGVVTLRKDQFYFNKSPAEA